MIRWTWSGNCKMKGQNRRRQNQRILFAFFARCALFFAAAFSFLERGTESSGSISISSLASTMDESKFLAVDRVTCLFVHTSIMYRNWNGFARCCHRGALQKESKLLALPEMVWSFESPCHGEHGAHRPKWHLLNGLSFWNEPKTFGVFASASASKFIGEGENSLEMKTKKTS